MKQIKLDLNNENQIKEISKIASESLKNGRAIVYPTDTLYGLGVNALDEDAIIKVQKIKKQDRNKPIPVIIRNIKMAKKISCIDSRVEKILNKIWPDSITIVLRKKDVIPYLLTGGRETVAMRISDNNFTKALFKKIDFPITSTSANISGESNLLNSTDIIKKFDAEKFSPDFFIDAEKIENSEPSTIVDLSNGMPRILRTGIVGLDRLKYFFEKFET